MFTENRTTELKREYVDDIKKTVIAFANTDGGRIYIGVNDNGAVCGVTDIDDTMLKVTNALRDTIRPDVTMFVECDNEIIDNKTITVVTVQRGTARPYYLAGKGIRPEGVYVRQGASTVPATDTAILNMIKETSGDCYEEARSLNQQLTFTKTAAFFKKHDLDFKDAQKRTLGLIGDDGAYTNLAFLLSEQCTHTIKLAVFEGSKKILFKDRRELSGSLLSQVEEAYDYIDRFNRTRAEFRGLDRIELRDYPPEAVREALLNAIVHRDYSFSGSTLISLFDDRIEWITIGGLVKGISLGDIMLGVSMLRNQRLANIFYRLKLIEAYGTGILKINECYDDFAVKPNIEVSDNAFKITLPNTNYPRESQILTAREPITAPYHAIPRDERERAILRLFKNKDTILRQDVQAALGVSQPTAILVLRELVNKGTLIKEGSGKYTHYRLG